MRLIRCVSVIAVWTGVAMGAASAMGQTHAFDVVVYGGTSGGVTAAVAASRMGRSVALLEPGTTLGGHLVAGISHVEPDIRDSIGGMARQFYQRVGRHYGVEIRWQYEPKVAEQIISGMIGESTVQVFVNHRLKDVRKDQAMIERITCENRAVFTATVFIDASYEGDLMAAAHVPYVVGRESSRQYGESLAGANTQPHPDQWPAVVEPRDRATGRLLSGIHSTGGEAPGSGDTKIAGYTYRLCLVREGAHRVEIGRPAGYDPSHYELLAALLRAKPNVTLDDLLDLRELPNGKYAASPRGPVSIDYLGGGYDYPDANDDQRDRIRQAHRRYVHGYLYYLAHEPSVPATLRGQMAEWGLAADEFTATERWPHTMHICESRRMVGQYVMTQMDLQTLTTKPDAIGMGSGLMIGRAVQRMATREGVRNDGGFFARAQPYQVPYGCLTPRASDCRNLLVAACVSSSHVAWSSMGREPMLMIYGHAAGVAAAMAAERSVSVQAVPIKPLQALLIEQGQLVKPAEQSASIDPSTLPGVVVDDLDAELTGEWLASTAHSPYVGKGYLHDNVEPKTRNTASFTPKLTAAGRYEVRLAYTVEANRATNVRVAVHCAEGIKHVLLNQRQSPAGEAWLRIGAWRFDAGTAGRVVIDNTGADGVVVVDAVQFLPVE